MNHLAYFTRIVLGTGLLTLCNWLPNYCYATSQVVAKPTSSLDRLLDKQKVNPVTIIKLLPFEILAGKATSYADLSVKLNNSWEEVIKVEITRIEIVTVKSEEVLLSSRSQELELPTKISLQPGENRILHYRLKSEQKIYQKGQKVYARIYYRQDEQLLERAISSQPQAVAFTIPQKSF